MAETKEDSLPVYKAPEWDDYECGGSGNCCHGWVVQVDDTQREKIENALEHQPHPKWGSTMPLEKHNDTNVMSMDDGKCPYLNEDNRCWLHGEFGSEVKPKFCQQFPRHEIETPVGIFKIVRFSCVTATDMLTEDEYRLPNRDYPVPDGAESMEPFRLDKDTPITPETYLWIEDTALGILDNERVTLSERLVTVGKYIQTASRLIKQSALDRFRRVSERYVETPTGQERTYPRNHSVLMDAFISFREAILGEEKQTQTHHEIQAILGTIRETFELGGDTDRAAEKLTELKRKKWDPSIGVHEYILKRYLKRQLWSKLFSSEFSLEGTVQILAYLFATIRLYSIAQAVADDADLQRWHLLNSIVKVEKHFTHAQGLQILWERTLNDHTLSNDRTTAVLCFL